MPTSAFTRDHRVNNGQRTTDNGQINNGQYIYPQRSTCHARLGRPHLERTGQWQRAGPGSLAPWALAVVTTEVPSATLNVHVAAGSYLRQDGTIGTYAGSVSQAMTASATNYLYLDLTNSGSLVVNTSGFPTTAHVRLATVVAGVTTITTITDARVAFNVIGSFVDGVNLTFGTSTGTQIGTAASQKLAFFGNTPIVQPTMGAATAGTSYTS